MLAAIEVMLIAKKERVGLASLALGMGRLALIAIIPLLLFLQMPTAASEDGVTAAFSNLAAYGRQGLFWGRIWDDVLLRTDSIFRVAESSWPVWDRLFGVLLWAGLGIGLLFGNLRLDSRLWLVTGIVAAMIWIMPPNMFGVGHLPERMPLSYWVY